MEFKIQNGKQKDIFTTAKTLFWKHGIKRVSIEEICKEANVSKMTFYKFFPNKSELAKNILQVVTEKAIQKFKGIIDGELPFPDKLKTFLILKHEGTKNISKEFISDIYKNPELGLLQYIEEQQQFTFKLFTDFIIDSQKKGLIRKEIKVDFILYYMNQMIQMINDEQLVSKYDSPEDLIMESMNFMFYGIMQLK